MLLVLFFTTAWPKNMTVGMAGFSLESSKAVNVAWHDNTSGYFAHKGWDCDGSHRSIRLTKDRRLLSGMGFDMKRFGRKGDAYQEVLEHPFRISTSHGIRIGMSQAGVTSKLGKPLKSLKTNEFTSIMYKKIVPGKVLRNMYIFKAGKLIEISLQLDSIPGCGEDSLSDEGWPWTIF